MNMTKTEKAVSDLYYDEDQLGHQLPWPLITKLGRKIEAAIDKAVAEERERCAKLAESPLCHCTEEDRHDGCCSACGVRIAKGIRES